MRELVVNKPIQLIHPLMQQIQLRCKMAFELVAIHEFHQHAKGFFLGHLSRQKKRVKV
jgi:hypothetical protein